MTSTRWRAAAHRATGLYVPTAGAAILLPSDKPPRRCRVIPGVLNKGLGFDWPPDCAETQGQEYQSRDASRTGFPNVS